MKTVSSTEAKAQLDALLAEVERTGSPVTITSRGRPVAVLSALRPRPRSFGQLPNMVIGADFGTGCVGGSRRWRTRRRVTSPRRWLFTRILLDTHTLLWSATSPDGSQGAGIEMGR